MDRTPLHAPVDEVLLLEDRAQVRRRARTELTAGRHRFTVEAVAPALADKTLVVVVDSGDGITIVNATVRRRENHPDLASETVDSPTAGLTRELKTLEQKHRDVSADLERVRDHLGALDRISGQTYSDLAVDVSFGQTIDDAWRERLQSLDERELELRLRAVDLSEEQSRLNQDMAQLEIRIESLATPAVDHRAWIDLDVDAEADVTAALRIDYVVPGACWRPQHRARLVDGDAPEVHFTSYARVWQNTGENWLGTQLRFSTERSSLGASPPRLTSDELRARKRSDEVVVETREQAVATTGLGTGGGSTPDLPGIDDGGATVNLRAPHRIDVPSNGRPCTVELSAFQTPAQCSLVGFPERSPCVFTKVVFENRGAGPILAGPVELIRRNGPVGRTVVLFVAPGENTEMGWGPEPDLRLKRTAKVQDEKSSRLSSWVTRDHRVTLAVSNIGDVARELTITERIPVSEIEQVKINLEADETIPQATSDRDGFVSWTFQLPARGTKQLALGYVVKKRDDVRGV